MKKLIPIRFNNYMLSGGSTKPWCIVAIEADSELMNEIAYVVKAFTINQAQQSYAIGKEFLCNALAAQFDLNVPLAYMIDLHDDDFMTTLKLEQFDELTKKHRGNTYASVLLSNASIINEEVKGSSFSIADCATLFAFDCLVLNSDRGGHRNKPNLLVDDEGFFLIDHELTFYFIEEHNSEDGLNKLTEIFNNNNWPAFYQKHLFYQRLKDFKGSKKHLFDTFEESLRTLDLQYVLSFVNDLAGEGIFLGEKGMINTYLSLLKQNSNKFRNILLGLIS